MSDVRSTANIDGVINAAADACIPVLDRGFLYGDSIYEVFRTYDGVPLFFDEHFDRLDNSARLIGMDISQTRTQLTEEIRRTAKASGATVRDDVYVRYQITRGVGPVDLFPSPDLATRYVIIVKELPPWNPAFYSTGLTMAIPGVRPQSGQRPGPEHQGGELSEQYPGADRGARTGSGRLRHSQSGRTRHRSGQQQCLVRDRRRPGYPRVGKSSRPSPRMRCTRALSQAGVDSIERDVHADELPRADGVLRIECHARGHAGAQPASGKRRHSGVSRRRRGAHSPDAGSLQGVCRRLRSPSRGSVPGVNPFQRHTVAMRCAYCALLGTHPKLSSTASVDVGFSA